jgi:hypothetical protein
MNELWIPKYKLNSILRVSLSSLMFQYKMTASGNGIKTSVYD